MNPKLRHLAEQAGITLPDESEYNSHIHAHALERYGKLIIQECAKVVEKEMDYHANWCDDKILKHFGMKE